MNTLLTEKAVHVFCLPKESSLQSTKESVGIGNEEERNIKMFG